jgi:hypothetical protein
MNIPIQPALEAKLRERAEAQGISMEAYFLSVPMKRRTKSWSTWLWRA